MCSRSLDSCPGKATNDVAAWVNIGISIISDHTFQGKLLGIWASQYYFMVKYVMYMAINSKSISTRQIKNAHHLFVIQEQEEYLPLPSQQQIPAVWDVRRSLIYIHSSRKSILLKHLFNQSKKWLLFWFSVNLYISIHIYCNITFEPVRNILYYFITLVQPLNTASDAREASDWAESEGEICWICVQKWTCGRRSGSPPGCKNSDYVSIAPACGWWGFEASFAAVDDLTNCWDGSFTLPQQL